VKAGDAKTITVTFPADYPRPTSRAGTRRSTSPAGVKVESETKADEDSPSRWASKASTSSRNLRGQLEQETAGSPAPR